jgi:protein-S-isoprenylcysteine O-methyltransferase Ste14
LPFMILVLVLRCLDEEKALREQLTGYDNYCKTVRYRLVPYVW